MAKAPPAYMTASFPDSEDSDEEKEAAALPRDLTMDIKMKMAEDVWESEMKAKYEARDWWKKLNPDDRKMLKDGFIKGVGQFGGHKHGAWRIKGALSPSQRFRLLSAGVPAIEISEGYNEYDNE